MDLLTFIKGTLWGLVLTVVYGTLSWLKFFFPDKFKKSVENETIVITGAGSGIGRLMAQKFSKLGAKIISMDIDEKGNNQTIKMLRAAGGEAFGYTCNLSNREEVYNVSAKIIAEQGPITMLINNAGIVSGADLLDTDDSKIELTFKVNTLAHFWTIKSFMPAMIENKKGHIVNIASLAGHCGCTKLVDYCSSKFGAVGIHEALKTELRSQGHDKYIKTSVVCPYFINTGMFDGVSASLLPILEPVDVAESVVQGVLTDVDTIFAPWYACYLVVLRAILPNQACLHFGDMLGTTSSMDDFRGRRK